MLTISTIVWERGAENCALHDSLLNDVVTETQLREWTIWTILTAELTDGTESRHWTMKSTSSRVYWETGGGAGKLYYPLEKSLSSLENENSTLKSKVKDLENHSCRNNFKIIGIPELEDRGKPWNFLVRTTSGLRWLSTGRTGPRDHHLQREPSPAPVHFYWEKELILHLRRAQELEYKGNKVLIFKCRYLCFLWHLVV